MDSAWAGAAHIVEGEYRTGAQEHLYIENQGVIAEYSEERGVTVWGSLQCPYYVFKALRAVFDLPEDKVRVIQTETGGAFGGKEDYPSTLACHAALLAMKSGHAVKMVYDRMEDLAATTKRHPARVRHRTALDRDGKLLAMEIQLDTDGGAYATLSATVLSRATLHSTGPYLCPNIRVRSNAWATNLVPYGAFRGFGAPQAVFAMERHMDEIAAALGIDPVELRRKNFLHDGDTNATEQVMREPMMLDQAAGSRAPGERLPCQAHAIRPGESGQPRQARHGDRGVLSRLRIYRLGRVVSEFAGRRGRYAGGQSASSGVEHRIRPGHEHDSHADCRRSAGHRIQRPDYGRARHRYGAKQRSDSRFPHVHGRGPLDRARMSATSLYVARAGRPRRHVHARGIFCRMRALSRRAR